MVPWRQRNLRERLQAAVQVDLPGDAGQPPAAERFIKRDRLLPGLRITLPHLQPLCVRVMRSSWADDQYTGPE